MKTIAGRPFVVAFLASSKSFPTFFSDSPSHFDMMERELMSKKVASISLATAAARSVFPHPGGP
jgi:hypothetical protein